MNHERIKIIQLEGKKHYIPKQLAKIVRDIISLFSHKLVIFRDHI